MSAVKFRAGLSKDLPANRDVNTLYWVTDTRQIYKGNDLYTDAVRVVSVLPAKPISGVLYIVNGQVMTYTGSEWVTISLTVTNDHTVNSETQLLSSSAVHTAINEAIEFALKPEGDAVINTIVSTEAGTITVTKGSTDESIDLAGVVYEPTFDAATRTITLPFNKVVEGTVEKDALVIALGQDMVVTNESHYDKENKKIVLVLTSGDTVEIPVEDLVSTINISSATGNALVELEDGLYVKDLSSDIDEVEARVAALVKAVDEHISSAENFAEELEANTKAISEINSTISAISESVNVNAEAIALINHENDGILAQAKAYADTKVGQIVWDVFEG